MRWNVVRFGPMLGVMSSAALAGPDAPLPKPADGWKIELVAEAPSVLYPTAIVAGQDGTLYVGQDAMDMQGPATSPVDSIVAIKPDGSKTIFAEKLWAVMGLEWVDGALIVVHAPYLSALRDANGDGKADQRVDLVTGLGPSRPGFNGINDHIASGVRLGIDGFLYIAVGDKGIPKATGTDGRSIQLFGGGVIRVRPDGTGLEVVSTGESNPLSVALSASDEIFTYGNDDDSKRWPNSLTHHIVGGHFGYPYDFLTRPDRCLPIVTGQIGGVGAQGICYNDAGLPERYRGNLFFCDWGLQTVFRYELERSGGTYRLKSREPVVTSGALNDFRPLSLCVARDGRSLYLTDWAYNGWLAPRAKTGRLYRLSCTDGTAASSAAEPRGNDEPSLIAALEHPALAARLSAQRALARQPASLSRLLHRLASPQPGPGRLHALWALDTSPDPKARAAIRKAAGDNNAEIRAQATRSCGIRQDKASVAALLPLLADDDAVVRREAAIALGKIGDRSAAPALLAALREKDRFVAWSIQHALKSLDAWDRAALVAALVDEKRRTEALQLTNEAWSLMVVQALVDALGKVDDAGARTKIVENLAGLYHQYPDWSGHWFGTNPLAGELPTKTKPWNPEAMTLVVVGLGKGLNDPDGLVRLRSLALLVTQVQAASAPLLRERLKTEGDALVVSGLIEGLGRLRDRDSVPQVIAILKDQQSSSVREAAVDALALQGGADALRARLDLIYDAKTPPELVARAMQGLARERALPPNDVAVFLGHKQPVIRAAALRAFEGQPAFPAELRAPVVARLEDKDPDVQAAAFEVVAERKVGEAVPALLRLSQQPATKEAASLALLQTPDARALPVYLAALADRNPALRRGSERVLGVMRDQVAAQLEARKQKGEFSGPAADAIERVLAHYLPIMDWTVIGPFPRTTGAMFIGEPSIDFARPHFGALGQPVRWGSRRGDPATGGVLIDDLKAYSASKGDSGYDHSASPELCAFAYAEVTSDRERPALLRMGSSGSLLLTLNEKIVFNSAEVAGRPYTADADHAKVTLAKGKNRILALSRQGVGPWVFSVQVSEPSNAMLAKVTTNSRTEQLRAFGLTHEGDAARGEKLFFDRRGIGCVKCHSAGGKGTSTLGPDLTGLALKYDKAEIARSVLDPSNRIATGYQPVVIARKDGKVLTGLVRLENDAFVYLINAESKITRVMKKDIAERKIGTQSVMPGGLVDGLTPGEFADLIAYLCSLKSTAMASESR
jgi:putative heme-binding domain-containing protein